MKAEIDGRMTQAEAETSRHTVNPTGGQANGNRLGHRGQQGTLGTSVRGMEIFASTPSPTGMGLAMSPSRPWDAPDIGRSMNELATSHKKDRSWLAGPGWHRLPSPCSNTLHARVK